jgi:hypothetical protein
VDPEPAEEPEMVEDEVFDDSYENASDPMVARSWADSVAWKEYQSSISFFPG